MIKNVFLGLGPMSKEVVNSYDNFSRKFNKKIMIICSRNQIETASLGGGYVNKFDTEKFAEFIKLKKNKNLILCRDHSGPFKKDGLKKKINHEIDNCKKSLKADIVNDFKIIHIDTSECKGAKYEIAHELINYCNQIAMEKKKKIFFEFGCEEHGVLTDFKQFKKDINFFTKFKNKQFIVCQTGSLVKSIFQVGQFDIDGVMKMKRMASEHGICLKEHNCDYLNSEQIKLRKKYGISAINIAPEFGSIQTNLLFTIAKAQGLNKEIEDFMKLVLKKDKWKKWNYNNENNFIKFLTSAHYYYNEKKYKIILNKISNKLNFQKHLNKIIEKNLIRYFNNT